MELFLWSIYVPFEIPRSLLCRSESLVVDPLPGELGASTRGRRTKDRDQPAVGGHLPPHSASAGGGIMRASMTHCSESIMLIITDNIYI